MLGAAAGGAGGAPVETHGAYGVLGALADEWEKLADVLSDAFGTTEKTETADQAQGFHEVPPKPENSDEDNEAEATAEALPNIPFSPHWEDTRESLGS